MIDRLQRQRPMALPGSYDLNNMYVLYTLQIPCDENYLA